MQATLIYISCMSVIKAFIFWKNLNFQYEYLHEIEAIWDIFFACQSGIPKGKKLGSKNLVTLSLWRLVALWGLSLTVYSMYKVCGLLSLLHDGVYWLLCLLHDGVYWLLGLLHDGVCILLSLLYDGVVDNFWVLSLMRFF